MTDFAYENFSPPQPESAAPPVVPPAPVAVFLRALAAEIDHGAPAPCVINLHTSGTVEMQLQSGDPAHEAAALAAWGVALGVTTFMVEHGWSTRIGDRYSVSSLFAGYRLEVWNAWQPDGIPGKSTSHVPLEQLNRGFDEPPTLCPLCGRPEHDEPCERSAYAAARGEA